MPVLVVLALACFVSSLSMRIVDPVVPAIARDLGVEVSTAALLASAFALPYALSQLPIGTLGDAIGTARIIKLSLVALVASLLASTFAPTFEMLFAARVIAGISAGGIITLSFAIVGDRFPADERQVALSRLLIAMLSSTLFGAVGTGLIAEQFGWRAVAVVVAVLTVLALALTLRFLPAGTRPAPVAFDLGRIRRDYLGILAHPLAHVCYLGVFTEGILAFGFMPYIAAMLETRGLGGMREAGFAIAGSGLGGLVYTVLVRILLDRLGRTQMVRAGGVLCLVGLGLMAVSHGWPAQMAALFVLGLGFNPVHNSLQTTATDLAPEARGKAMAMHAFSFFLGMAAGPILYRIGFAVFGTPATFAIAAIGLFALAQWIAGRLEAHRISMIGVE